MILESGCRYSGGTFLWVQVSKMNSTVHNDSRAEQFAFAACVCFLINLRANAPDRIPRLRETRDS